MKRLTLVTDAWHPQTNGVVNTLTRLVKDLANQGTDVQIISPEGHKTVPLPSYPEYRIAIDPWKALPRIRQFKPDAIHIATEGPLGFWTNGFLRRRRLRFTTSFHTRFPEYLSARYPIPLAFGYWLERWFHRPAHHTLVGTRSLIKELDDRRVGGHLVHWPRGVDLDRFQPTLRREDVYAGLPRPIWLYVGRVAAEKSLADFLKLPLPGTKLVVGDGPEREPLSRRHPDVVWRGYLYGDELAKHFASADCFVFPSRTETFGNVILEALASGLPVASVPAPGPIDLLQEGVNGAVDDDLHAACMRAIRCSGERARASTRPYTYRASHDLFRSYLVPLIPRLPASTSGTISEVPAAPTFSQPEHA
ncbi:MAG TPA: glycosyltransferase family 1 protein [Polyangiaceae bacterium]|nr:glycosyltransferase family 1 protein [Polyangiaceae bacterium]